MSLETEPRPTRELDDLLQITLRRGRRLRRRRHATVLGSGLATVLMALLLTLQLMPQAATDREVGRITGTPSVEEGEDENPTIGGPGAPGELQHPGTGARGGTPDTPPLLREPQERPEIVSHDGIPTWTGRIAFVRNDRIMLIISGGVEPQDLGPGRNPAWSPDGTLLAFTGREPTHGSLYVMRPDGTDRRKVIETSYVIDHPAWSPDGQRLVFSGRGGTAVASTNVIGSFLATVNLDGSGLTRLTEGRSDHADQPAWSPDGGTIAFRSGWGGGGWSVQAIAPDGSNRRVLLPGSAEAQSPSWSPDGAWLAYQSGVAEPGSPARIWVARADGTEARRLTGGSMDRFPSWSPDGSFIAFSRLYRGADGYSGEAIYIMRPDGSDQAAVMGDPPPIGDSGPSFGPA